MVPGSIPKMIFEGDCKEEFNFEQITETAKEIQNLSPLHPGSGIGRMDNPIVSAFDSTTGEPAICLGDDETRHVQTGGMDVPIASNSRHVIELVSGDTKMATTGKKWGACFL